MARTVVGLFQNQQEAQNVKHDLINEGYSAENIRLIANEGQTGTTRVATTTEKVEDSGIAAAISNFFRSFTGGDPEDEKHYTEGVSGGGTLLAVTVPDDRADNVAALLEGYGARNVDEQAVSSDATKQVPAGTPTGQKLNVVEEELQVGKRQVQRGGVRVYSHVTERPVEENITLRNEKVHVERHSVNRPATEADFNAFKEGAIELTETAEEAVVSKKARVVEEVVIGKEVSERQETVKDTVRRTDVKIEQLGVEQSSEYAQWEPQFRKHFDTNYAKAGASYDLYSPAYRYGHKLAIDPRYAQSDWSKVESAAKSDWTNNGSGSWEDMKAAVRHGWDKVRGAGNQ